MIIITKDEDFADMVLQLRHPPHIIWITTGNISNTNLNRIILNSFEEAVFKLIKSDFGLIEIK